MPFISKIDLGILEKVQQIVTDEAKSYDEMYHDLDALWYAPGRHGRRCFGDGERGAKTGACRERR